MNEANDVSKSPISQTKRTVTATISAVGVGTIEESNNTNDTSRRPKLVKVMNPVREMVLANAQIPTITTI